MDLDLFEVEGGLALDSITQVLTGASVPGSDLRTDAAPVGSLYLHTSGSSWKKIVAGSGSNKWSLESDSGIFRATNVSGTTRVDAIATAQTEVAMWMVIASLVSDATKKEVVVVTAAHNGNQTLAATDSKLTISQKMKFGLGVTGLGYATDLVLDSGTQVLELMVTAPNPINLQVTRITTDLGFGAVGGAVWDASQISTINSNIAAIQALLTSSNVNLDTVQEIVTYIEANQAAITTLGSNKVNVSDVINVLTDASTNKPLSAAQGTALKVLLDSLTGVVNGKAPAANPTLTGTSNADDFIAKRYLDQISVVSISAGVLTLDLSAASFFVVSLNVDITSVVLQNVYASGKAAAFSIKFVADGTVRSIAWPSSIKWPNATVPTMTGTATKVDLISFVSHDGGANWYGFAAGQNM